MIFLFRFKLDAGFQLSEEIDGSDFTSSDWRHEFIG